LWDRAGNLAGGAYGLAVGRVFFTESQFSRQRDASKAGYATLNCHLQRWGYLLNDGKHLTDYLSQLGFTLIPRLRSMPCWPRLAMSRAAKETGLSMRASTSPAGIRRQLDLQRDASSRSPL
jgi:Leu/Phe-tRNA-protein transferase